LARLDKWQVNPETFPRAHATAGNSVGERKPGRGAMRRFIFAGAAIAPIAAPTAHSRPETNVEQILGTWKVETLKVTSGGEVSYPLGQHPSGFVTMTPERMWLLFVDSARKQPASPTLTDAEAVAMMKSQVAWTGKYTVGDRCPMASRSRRTWMRRPAKRSSGTTACTSCAWTGTRSLSSRLG
jgi:hypothetical protein